MEEILKLIEELRSEHPETDPDDEYQGGYHQALSDLEVKIERNNAKTNNRHSAEHEHRD